MFYNFQTDEEKIEYKEILSIVGGLSRLFSDNECPYLYYRAHENIFCKYFNAVNLGRADCSIDAKKGKVGIGLKTWMGGNDQKVAEFGKNRPLYENKTGAELIQYISNNRNKRIHVTKNIYGVKDTIYHVLKRIPGKMQILECAMLPIDIDRIRIDNNRGNKNNTYFEDGNNTYHFSSSKNTLFMSFDNMELMDEFSVDILPDPFESLNKVFDKMSERNINLINPSLNRNKNTICLPLYSLQGGVKTVFEASGLNQWNAKGRPRDPNEIYIPYSAEARKTTEGFFPSRDTPFKLHLPNGKTIEAKVCQENGKAIMSNPNKELGQWLLRDILELPEKTILTYQMLQEVGIDSLIFTKNTTNDYSVDFSSAGSYEEYYNADNL